MAINVEKTEIKPQTAIRLDKALAQVFPQYTRRLFRRWIEQGSVWVNNKRIRKQGFILHPGQTYTILFYPIDLTPIHRYLSALNWEQRILYQDSAILAINKPAGINAYPTPYAVSDTIFYYLQHKGLLDRSARPFHRLDRPVSGLMVIPITHKAAADLNRQLAEKSITKYYLALVHGIPKQDSWEIQGYIQAPTPSYPSARFFPTTKRGAKFSHTRFHFIWKAPTSNLSLILAIPITGRTHQIRLHLQVSGHPIVNDTRYGGTILDTASPFPFIFLHHTAMSFSHPHYRKTMTLQAPLPEYFYRWIPADLSWPLPEFNQ